MRSEPWRTPLLLTLAWRNLWRHTRRTLMILFAFVLGVWSMIVIAAITRGSMEQQLDNSILNLTGHIQAHAAGFRDDPVIDHRFTPSAELTAALDDKDIIARAGRVRAPGVVASERESAGITLVGIEPAREHGLSFIATAVTEGRYLESAEDQGLLLGRKLAERLETGLGRRVVLMSQDANNQVGDRGFRVVGIFETQPRQMEDSVAFIGRATAQQMLKLGDAVTEVAIMTANRDQLDVLLARLRAVAPALDIQPWTVIEPLLVLTQKVTDVILLIWYAIVFAAMSFGLINTLLMAVFERTREFGLFQSLGMPPRHILGQVLVESLILLALALVLGNLAAWATIASLQGGIDLSSVAEGMELIGVAPVIYPAWSASDLAIANLLVFVLGLAASLYPAWRASQHVPVEALTRA